MKCHQNSNVTKTKITWKLKDLQHLNIPKNEMSSKRDFTTRLSNYTPGVQHWLHFPCLFVDFNIYIISVYMTNFQSIGPLGGWELYRVVELVGGGSVINGATPSSSRRFWVFAFLMIFSVKKKKSGLGYFWSTLLWHRCYYLHRSRDALSSVCGIFTLIFIFNHAFHLDYNYQI